MIVQETHRTDRASTERTHTDSDVHAGAEEQSDDRSAHDGDTAKVRDRLSMTFALSWAVDEICCNGDAAQEGRQRETEESGNQEGRRPSREEQQLPRRSVVHAQAPLGPRFGCSPRDSGLRVSMVLITR